MKIIEGTELGKALADCLLKSTNEPGLHYGLIIWNEKEDPLISDHKEVFNLFEIIEETRKELVWFKEKANDHEKLFNDNSNMLDEIIECLPEFSIGLNELLLNLPQNNSFKYDQKAIEIMLNTLVKAKNFFNNPNDEV